MPYVERYTGKERITVPTTRFFWIIKLCRLLLKYAGKGGYDETWERTIERKDGKTEFEFYIKCVMPARNK